MKYKKFQSVFCALVIFCLSFAGKEVFGNELKQQWQTSATYKFILSVRDKWNLDKTFKAKYVVKTSPDLVFIAEREGVAMDSSSTEVVFPDDFSVPETGEKAWIKFDGEECTWEIFVNEMVMESGTFLFTRSKGGNRTKSQ